MAELRDPPSDNSSGRLSCIIMLGNTVARPRIIAKTTTTSSLKRGAIPSLRWRQRLAANILVLSCSAPSLPWNCRGPIPELAGTRCARRSVQRPTCAAFISISPSKQNCPAPCIQVATASNSCDDVLRKYAPANQIPRAPSLDPGFRLFAGTASAGRDDARPANARRYRPSLSRRLRRNTAARRVGLALALAISTPAWQGSHCTALVGRQRSLGRGDGGGCNRCQTRVQQLKIKLRRPILCYVVTAFRS